MDVVVFGGGVAGLWILDAVATSGRSAILLENRALGAGQTLQSQGIVHGGGKYALRGVRDFAAAQAIREMPERWRRHLRGEGEPGEPPDLSGVEVLSERSYLWDLCEGGVLGALRRKLLPVIARAGVLHSKPRRLARAEWPDGLLECAASVYAMDEPVLAARSLLEALARPHRDRILLTPAPVKLQQADSKSWHVTATGVGSNGELAIDARVVVLAAGAGNESLLTAAGIADSVRMQRRPLQMILLRGALPEIQGHWVRGAQTTITITTAAGGSPAGRVWAVGGQVAELNAHEPDEALAQGRGVAAIRTAFPQLDLSGCQVASYVAVRAEASTTAAHRPSGVHLSQPAPGLLAAWPTKLALAPVLADATVVEVDGILAGSGAPSSRQPFPLPPPSWPRPELGAYPWETATWNAIP